MIEIKDKKNCCGCEACAQKCPKHCITMREDSDGFLFPVVNQELCVNCHICENICPVTNRHENTVPLIVYAGKNVNESTVKESSSGGIFSCLAEYIIGKGGIVFGAEFNEDWNVVHNYYSDLTNIKKFRQSKYVQSKIGNSYCNAEHFLKQGKYVLFTGTPCQISGLKNYLKKDFDNLITVDFVCHGVPSPKIWREYLKEIKHDYKIKDVRFRDKSLGWKRYCLRILMEDKNNKPKIIREDLNHNRYLLGFINNIFLRKSCYHCPTKKLSSGSDITIGDFWNMSYYDKDIKDNNGLSLIIINTNKGNYIIEDIKDKITTSKIENYSIDKNFALACSVQEPTTRANFFSDSCHGCIKALNKYTSQKTLLYRIIKKILK